METADGPTDCCKVGRSLAKYGLTGYDRELATRWTAEGEEREGLRALATDLDREVLAAAMGAAGVQPLDGEVANLHRLLTGDSDAERLEARRRLERGGVDVDEVTGDFVSHQSVHTHLTDCLGVERSRRPADPRRRVERVRALQGRLAAVAEETVEGLRGDDVALGEFDVIVGVSVVCEECGRSTDLGELVDAGGCDCRR